MNHMMKSICMTLLWFGWVLSATATDVETPSGKRDEVAVGSGTTQWLDTQREGRVAGNMLPIPPAEAGPSYERYIDSFGNPIPGQSPSQMSAPGARR